MKIPALVKLLLSIIFIVIIATSCKKEKPVIVKNDNTAEVKRLTIKADKYFSVSEYKNALPIYKKIISLSDKVKDRADYVDALISLGYIYQYQGDYIQSEETIIKIFPHLKYLKKTRFAWNAYFIQGFNYFKTGNHERALFYFKKALHLKTSRFRKWSILNSIGIVYMKQKRYKAAAYIFEKITTEGYYAYRFKTKTYDRYELMDYTVMLNNLGICYQNLNNPKAIDYYYKALEIRLRINDRDNISTSYAALSEYYLKTNPELTIKYAKLGYKKASEINFYVDKKYCLGFLVQSTKGNELKKYTNMYIHFIDSINTAQLKQKNQFSDIKYNFRKDKEENLYLKKQKAENELQLQRQKNRSSISYVIISISTLVLFFLAYYITARGKKEKNQAVFKSEMRLSDKLHNEITEDIYRTLLFSKNHELENRENKEKFLSDMNTIYIKTRKISRENSVILTDDNYVDGLKEMISGYTNSNLNIIINGLNSFSWSKIDRLKKITVFRVLQEIFHNMESFNSASLISIAFKSDSKNITITYADNSTKIQNLEITPDIKLDKRFANVKNRLKSVKGDFDITLNPNLGFKIFIKLPL